MREREADGPTGQSKNANICVEWKAWDIKWCKGSICATTPAYVRPFSFVLAREAL